MNIYKTHLKMDCMEYNGKFITINLTITWKEEMLRAAWRHGT
jgi:hypothetical protein